MRNSALHIAYIVLFEECLVVLLLPLAFIWLVFLLRDFPADLIRLIGQECPEAHQFLSELRHSNYFLSAGSFVPIFIENNSTLIPILATAMFFSTAGTRAIMVWIPTVVNRRGRATLIVAMTAHAATVARPKLILFFECKYYNIIHNNPFKGEIHKNLCRFIIHLANQGI